MFIDSHAHLEMPQFEEDLPEVLKRAEINRVEQIVTIGTNLKSSQRALETVQRHPHVFAVVGIHPHNAKECTPESLEHLRELAAHPKVVAIGEMGLDFYRNLSPPEQQILVFRLQIRLARELAKPIVVHDRDAHKPVLQILEEEGAEEVGGVIHCFSGDLPMARHCLDMGFRISVPGSITFKNSARLRNVVVNLPLDSLLLETDSPFLAPIPFRGKRNEPAYIRHIAERAAKIRKMPLDDFAQVVLQNTRRFFGLPATN